MIGKRRLFSGGRGESVVPMHVCCLLIGLCAAVASAHDEPGRRSDVGAAATTIRVGPFLQSATPNAIWIAWETDQGEESRVDYGLTPALGSTVFGQAIPGAGSAWIHHTLLTDLAPDTRYYYRASTDGVASGLLHFRSPPPAGAETPFRFVAYADTQADSANPGKHHEVINEGIISFIAEHFGPDMPDELAFVLNAGDLVESGDVHSQWKEDFFDQAQNLFQHVPLYPVPGNHENDSHWYFDYFRVPDNGSAEHPEHWYFVDYANVRIICLDSNEGYRIQVQLDWLDNVLAGACADADIDFVFAQLHHPHKSELWTPGEIDYTGQIIQRFERFSDECGKPSVHFFGHTHGYSRGQSRDSDHLWVNVATGGGNIDYWGEFPNADYPEFQRTFPDWGFALIEVEGGEHPLFRLRRISRGNEVVPRDNEVMDTIVIRRDNGPPLRPEPVFPTIDDSPVAPDLVILLASAFADIDGDGHLESRFQVTTDSGDYTAPVIDEWIRVENWYSPPGASGMSDGHYSVNTAAGAGITRLEISRLDEDQTYYWRVRYRDAGLAWSDWSGEAAFLTGQSYGPNLLANGGAEDDTTGWTIVDPPLESLAADECASATSPVSGSRFFAIGGVCSEQGLYGEAFQSVDVSSWAVGIDAGRVNACFCGFVKDASGADLPEFWLVFIDGLGQTIAETAKLGTAASEWGFLDAVVAIPHATRAVEFHISGTRHAGMRNDSYLDRLTLHTFPDEPPEDINGDGAVDTEDLLILLGNWGGSGDGDVDNNGAVNTTDLLLLLAAWREG
jgi:hypothetical protein